MRRLALASVLAIVMGVASLTSALGQINPNTPPPVTLRAITAITPLSFYALGSIGCAAVAPMIGTVVLGREMTAAEVGRSTLSCFLGPVGWWLGAELFPLEVAAPNGPTRNPPGPGARQTRGRNINIPPPGETHFVPNEALVEFDAGSSAQYLAALVRSLQLTPLETETFALTGRTLQRWRIDGARSVPNTLRAMSRFG